MLNKEITTLNFYDAVIANDGPLVRKILSENNNHFKISTRVITGILIIAFENHLYNSVREILSYNDKTTNKIAEEHLNNFLCLASKAGLLKNFNITFH